MSVSGFLLTRFVTEWLKFQSLRVFLYLNLMRAFRESHEARLDGLSFGEHCGGMKTAHCPIILIRIIIR